MKVILNIKPSELNLVKNFIYSSLDNHYQGIYSCQLTKREENKELKEHNRLAEIFKEIS